MEDLNSIVDLAISILLNLSFLRKQESRIDVKNNLWIPSFEGMTAEENL
jgi:hypothetical protein